MRIISTFLSRLTFAWFNPVILAGSRKTLTPDDLPELEPDDTGAQIGEQFHLNWKKTPKSAKPNIILALVRSFGGYFALGALCQLGAILVQFSHPQLLKILISYITNPESCGSWSGSRIAAAFFATALLASSLKVAAQYVTKHVDLKLCTALRSAIYRKSLRLSPEARSKTTAGEMINLMSSDTDRLGLILSLVNALWSGPVQILVAMYLLWLELGVAFVAGFVVLIALVPLNSLICRLERVRFTAQIEEADARLKEITELLTGIRIVKLFAWELPFARRITEIRTRELEHTRAVANYTSCQVLAWGVTPFLVSAITFIAYILLGTGGPLDAGKIFTSLALFEIIRTPLLRISHVWGELVAASIFVERLNRFLGSDELEPYVEVGVTEPENVLEVKNGNFTWNSTGPEILTDINLKIKQGSLVAIVGQVGSGKSSLLSAILGQMHRNQGRVTIAPDLQVSLVSQQAWLLNTTLRENILFGSPYDRTRYEAVLRMCALGPDLAQLPAGDQTEIGERGITLSGGQKQRIALARAAYSHTHLVLLDDPLSAVDSHVSKHLFRELISSRTGFLENRTRILVTNAVSYLPEVDQIIVLEDGKITEVGNYQQLKKSGKFAEFLREHSAGKQFAEDQSSKKNAEPERLEKIPESSDQAAQPEESNTEAGLQAYRNYFRAFSWTCFWCVITGYSVSQACLIGSQAWLADWSADDSSANYRKLGIYALFGLAQAGFMVLATVAIGMGNVRSSAHLHQRLLDRILHAPTRFFDITPLGRILARFGSDLNLIDSRLPYNFDGWITCVVQLASFLVLLGLKLPVFILVCAPIAWLYFYIQSLYTPTTRQLKRGELAAKSPIYSHFAETLAGVSCIRAYRAGRRFMGQSAQRLDAFNRFYCSDILADCWLLHWLELCSNLVTVGVVCLMLVSGTQDSGLVGLILIQTVSLTESLNFLVRAGAAVQRSILSVERILEYCRVEQEASWTGRNQNPELPDQWPEDGEIEFRDYAVRYRENLSLVLDGLSVKVGAGQKVGVVGRTGAGKSSLSLGLFRILEAARGEILIDGVPIQELGLHELRSRFSIIPQDPILFSGTIRSNLDPFGVFRDELLWSALEQCHMSDFLQGSGLDYPVAEGGTNLSVGQRQLLCLGRALLRRTRILILDEATAAVDLETDALIQRTIRRECANCTVITIAHRLDTVMDSDRILVLDQGKMVEYDTPTRLLKDKESKFYALARDSGLC